MARKPRFCPPGLPVHVVQRGVNRFACFSTDRDKLKYANWLCEGAEKHDVSIHGWVFMTNHVHMLMTAAFENGVSNLMQGLGTRYARYFNRRYERTGGLFEGKFKASLVQSDGYFLNCMQYIELNPVRARIVKDPADYHWSSYRCHAYGEKAAMWTPHAVYEGLADAPADRQSQYRAFVSNRISDDLMSEIRHCVNTGETLGSEAYRKDIDRLRN